jgi:2-haloacid dehalogenase
MGTTTPQDRIPGADSPLALPDVLLFDVYDTLFDLSPLGAQFVDVGAPAQLAPTWLTTVLLHGFALTAAHAPAQFRPLAGGVLRSSLR